MFKDCVLQPSKNITDIFTKTMEKLTKEKEKKKIQWYTSWNEIFPWLFFFHCYIPLKMNFRKHQCPERLCSSTPLKIGLEQRLVAEILDGHRFTNPFCDSQKCMDKFVRSGVIIWENFTGMQISPCESVEGDYYTFVMWNALSLTPNVNVIPKVYCRNKYFAQLLEHTFTASPFVMAKKLYNLILRCYLKHFIMEDLTAFISA